ncbi:hypothetical protein ACROYT_G005306 [Oculina patagonica]
MDWITRTFKAGFEEFKERTSVGVTHLEDVGALVDDNLFERDILIATKKLASSSNIPERTQAVKDLGHLSWSGGPSAAKFAGNQLVNLLSVLNNPSEPTVLKMRRSSAACLLTLACENLENQKTLLGTNRLQDYLTSVSAENWTAWEENEAAQLITFLGLDHSADQGSRWAKIRALGASLGGETPQH